MRAPAPAPCWAAAVAGDLALHTMFAPIAPLAPLPSTEPLTAVEQAQEAIIAAQRETCAIMHASLMTGEAALAVVTEQRDASERELAHQRERAALGAGLLLRAQRRHLANREQLRAAEAALAVVTEERDACRRELAKPTKPTKAALAYRKARAAVKRKAAASGLGGAQGGRLGKRGKHKQRGKQQAAVHLLEGCDNCGREPGQVQARFSEHAGRGGAVWDILACNSCYMYFRSHRDYPDLVTMTKGTFQTVNRDYGDAIAAGLPAAGAGYTPCGDEGGARTKFFKRNVAYLAHPKVKAALAADK